MSTELIVIALLATYRLTQMFNNEAGPADIFGRFRTRIGVTFDAYSNPVASNWVAEGILCFYCLSVWIAFGVSMLIAAAALLNHIDVAQWILFPFAISGAAVFMKKWAG
ncbi:MAG: hypothetical protein H0X30_01355 [Anaerolineae bacterium]|nr:hypothetical protein [Anaerolineae bacterium]